MSKPRVLHIITGLGVGGAEHTLLLLLESLRREFTFHVATLADDLTLRGVRKSLVRR